MSPAESSGASPDREATGVDLMKAWYGDDTTWGIIKEFERDRWRRLADRVSLLGAAPREDASETDRPKIVCLCGSTRFPAEFMAAQFAETIAGAIVLSVGCFPRKPDGSWDRMMVTEEQKVALDALHLRKIDLADEVFVVNVGGYIGESTSREIAYAKASGKPVLYLEPVGATEPAKEPCQCWDIEHVHPAPPVMDEAAREAPELCQVLPAGYVVTLNDGNGLNYRMGAPDRIVSYHATRWEAESAAFEAYGRAAWAHGDADAALLAEAHKELSRLHGNLNHTVSLADGCGCRSGRVLAKLDARLGERP